MTGSRSACLSLFPGGLLGQCAQWGQWSRGSGDCSFSPRVFSAFFKRAGQNKQLKTEECLPSASEPSLIGVDSHQLDGYKLLISCPVAAGALCSEDSREQASPPHAWLLQSCSKRIFSERFSTRGFPNPVGKYSPI